MQIHLIVVFLLLASVEAQQNSCSCSCCIGQSCNLALLPTVYVQSCTLETCLAKCRETYSQCQSNYPNGQISVQCGSSTTVPQYSCQCNCCNTGSASCSPNYVGNSLAYTCQSGACSIACSDQYPNQCVSNQNGQTQGTCMGIINTTPTTTTAVGFWLGNVCSCMCCQTGSFCSPTYVGATSASRCSSSDCTQACLNNYPLSCPASYNIGRTEGTCLSSTSGGTSCSCRCCGTTGCINNYIIGTNGGCGMCDSLCRQYVPCNNAYQITATCNTGNAKTSHSWMAFTLITALSTFFILN